MSPERLRVPRSPAGDLLPGPSTYAPDRHSWRAWLERHHSSATEVWLVFFKRHTGTPSPTLDEAVEEALCFGWIDGKIRSVDADRHAYRFTPRKAASPWSPTNVARMKKLLAAGLVAPAGLATVEQAKRSGRWGAPRTRDPGTTVPPELLAALAANPKARAFFEALAAGHRREYVAWVSTAKREATRAARVARVIDRCAHGVKPGIDL
jgi:uncharacterized protein YdeI (YjbR/CyaY-like superfamily)